MKRYLSILLVALMMFTVLFVSISCKEKIQEDPKYVVTFDTQGGSKVKAVEVDAGGKVKKPTEPARDDYFFLGWYTDTTWKTEFDFKNTIINADTTIYAKWIDTYTYLHDGVPVLPAGSGQVIPSWSVGDGGYSNLPAFITDGSTTNVTAEIKAALTAVNQDFFDEVPKRVIVIIGDGMGISHLDLSREYKGELIMDLLPYFTESKTDSYLKQSKATSANRTEKETTDSCAGGTQILCGYKTRYGYMGVDIDRNEIQNLSEVAKTYGWKTACVTNDWVTDATPADTLVHNPKRDAGDVLAYQELMENMPDLLLGGGNLNKLFVGTTGDNATWAKRLENLEKSGMDDAIEVEFSGDSTKAAKLKNDGPIEFYKSLTADEKIIVNDYSVYYRIWSTRTDKSVAFETWLTSGLNAYCTNLDKAEVYGNPEDHVTKVKSMAELIANAAKEDGFSKSVYFGWSDLGGNKYSTAKPGVGYLLKGKTYPNFSEMVAYTLYQMDKMVADDNTSDGFFCMIENTCTDGWGHAQKPYDSMNEVQCCDEGVAIAVKYVLEHPDTLLIVTADHETGGYSLRNGWETDVSAIRSSTGGHSSQNVPCIAFGAGADKFSAANIAAAYSGYTGNGIEQAGYVHENWITGSIIGRLMKASGSGESFESQTFGQPAIGYPAAL